MTHTTTTLHGCVCVRAKYAGLTGGGAPEGDFADGWFQEAPAGGGGRLVSSSSSFKRNI